MRGKATRTESGRGFREGMAQGTEEEARGHVNRR